MRKTLLLLSIFTLSSCNFLNQKTRNIEIGCKQIECEEQCKQILGSEYDGFVFQPKTNIATCFSNQLK